MFELLIGEHPMDADCDDGFKIDNEKVKELLEKEGIPKILIDFIMGCIEKDPKKRYSWQDLFTHELFEGLFLNEQNGSKQEKKEGTGQLV